MNESDIYLKDEGDFITVCFQTPKAIETIDHKNSADVKKALGMPYGSDSYRKYDIDKHHNAKIYLYRFAKENEITIEDDLDFESDLDY